jgi:hypothetical protein
MNYKYINLGLPPPLKSTLCTCNMLPACEFIPVGKSILSKAFYKVFLNVMKATFTYVYM